MKTFTGRLIAVVLFSVLQMAGCVGYPSSEKRAADIARKEVFRRETWNVPIEVTTFPTQDGGWLVQVWRIPKVPGGYRDVVVSKDGTVVEYRHGR